MEDTKKKCTYCQVEKDKTEFTKSKRQKDGLNLYCKSCSSIKAKKSRAKSLDHISKYNKKYSANKRASMTAEEKEELKVQKKKYYAENRERHALKSKVYYQENKEKILKHNKEYRDKNKEKLAKTSKIWRQSNPIKRLENHMRRRAKKKGNGIFYISEKEITKLLSSNCYICQANPSEHLDHIVPISKGGTHSIGNLLGACQKCNLEKGSKTLYEYKRQRATREVLRPL